MLEENEHLFDGLVDFDSGFQKHSEKKGMKKCVLASSSARD
jgi:hypothetical protein